MAMVGAILGCFVGLCAPEYPSSSPALFASADDFRTQHIHRLPSEASWPFTVDEGILLCTWVLGDPAVYFAAGVQEFGSANASDADSEVRILVLSNDIVDLVLLNFINADLFVEQVDPGRRLEMVLPYFETGARLCDQPKGTTLPSGEL
ncbi:MAG: hypothetical protein AAFR39_09480 [Pseudomonadota bacterium]